MFCAAPDAPLPGFDTGNVRTDWPLSGPHVGVGSCTFLETIPSKIIRSSSCNVNNHSHSAILAGLLHAVLVPPTQPNRSDLPCGPNVHVTLKFAPGYQPNPAN